MKNLSKVLTTVKKQSGTIKNIRMDKMITAMPPGKRMSVRGKIYYETRKNRTDLKNNL